MVPRGVDVPEFGGDGEGCEGWCEGVSVEVRRGDVMLVDVVGLV